MTHRFFIDSNFTKTSINAVCIFSVMMVCSCTSFNSSDPTSSSERTTQTSPHIDQADDHALLLASQESDVAAPGASLASTNATSDDNVIDALLEQSQEGLFFGTSIADDASWATLAMPLLGIEQLPEFLDLLTNQTLIELLDPPSLPSNPTFLEQSCRNRGLPDFFCRQRYGS